MISRLRLAIIVPLIAMAACNNNDRGKTSGSTNADGTLSVSIVNNPRTANGMDSVAAGSKPFMKFTDTLHDFGHIKEGEIVQHDFPFTNTGKSPLIITTASASCGCTVPEYPHDPIEPGKTGIMKVTFNSANKLAHQEKAIMIHTNTVRGIEMLYIKAEVDNK